ncbi:glycosyltransferase family 4 protein [Shimia sediminis]|uniref:glycosyltransferase family 4 protein n=1 Tax=Shimia sediminis TaxID=2497945 RepID=UPI000F8F7CAE|nr:glycosyltransferase [Shimia sediminis]
MARIAFYAPMKTPNHPVPSGDREMARGIMAALEHPFRKAEVELVSEFRSYEGKGDTASQNHLINKARVEAERLEIQGGWDAWVTYHNYYKAPDLIGPAVSKALGIPYLLIEATRASKRLDGPWDQFARASDAACDAASAIFYLTALDAEGLAPYRRDDQPMVNLHPFLRSEHLPAPSRGQSILSVGMMRHGDKLASYKIIAETLAHLSGDWRYDIVGDGPARSDIEALFATFGDKVRFLGQRDAEEVQAAYDGARVFLWPGVNEAFGMVYLEAQAAGVPVVAQDRPGVRDVVPTSALVPVGQETRLANAVAALLQSDTVWSTRSLEARELVGKNHLITAARQTLWSVLDPLLEEGT